MYTFFENQVVLPLKAFKTVFANTGFHEIEFFSTIILLLVEKKLFIIPRSSFYKSRFVKWTFYCVKAEWFTNIFVC